MTTSATNSKNELIIQAADDKQARDIRTLPIREEAGICDYFIVMTGRNKIHTQAIADAITQKLAEAEMAPTTTEGLRDGGWILLDCGETIVHIFTQSEREFYDLDDLWSE
ncbi:ribosome silencing factor [Murdochiella massiliensis]|uniref:ribosome silencing factor n=1 Tax=Murdochiella massiliensis TaxID=1673723 RepID=UPI00082DA51D|nr:ribosome silencing factor [Murdochiella massiliensis]MBY0584909.1 ribosome silencing factor [Murdochiella sp. Marseille-P8839]